MSYFQIEWDDPDFKKLDNIYIGEPMLILKAMVTDVVFREVFSLKQCLMSIKSLKELRKVLIKRVKEELDADLMIEFPFINDPELFYTMRANCGLEMWITAEKIIDHKLTRVIISDVTNE